MPSAKQIAWRKKFAKLYGKKKAGKKWNPKVPLTKAGKKKLGYSEGGKPENLKWMYKYKKYNGTSTPANPDYVFMLDPANNLVGVKKSDVKKYKLGKRKYSK